MRPEKVLTAVWPAEKQAYMMHKLDGMERLVTVLERIAAVLERQDRTKRAQK